MGTEVWHSTQLTIASLFFNAVFTLLVFVLANLLLQRFMPRLAMSQADLQTIYVMVVMLTTISGHTMMGYLIPVLAHTFQFASPENEWIPLFGHHIPTWLAVKSPRVLDGFYNGDSTLYTSATLNAWVPPVLSWSSFVIALWLTLLAVTVFLRKQWTENERLNYPIVQLPLALTSNPRAFFYFAVDVARFRAGRQRRTAERFELSVSGCTRATDQRQNNRTIQLKTVECDGTDPYLFLPI